MGKADLEFLAAWHSPKWPLRFLVGTQEVVV